MKIRHLAIAISSLLCAAAPAFAIQRLQSTAQTSGDVEEDLGDVRPADKTPILSRFRVSAQAQGEWVANAALLGNTGSGDFLSLPTLEVGYNQPLRYGFGIDLDAKLETVIYSQFSDRGFWGGSGAATVDWRYRPTMPRLFISAEPYRYNSFDTGDRAAAAVALSTGFDHGYFINRGKTLLFGGYKFSHFYADPSADNRDSHRLTVGVTQQFRPALYGQLYYSYQYTDFLDYSRHDSRNVVGVNFVYQFSQHVFASLTSSFVDNDSSRRLADYRNVTVGAAFTLQY